MIWRTSSSSRRIPVAVAQAMKGRIVFNLGSTDTDILEGVVGNFGRPTSFPRRPLRARAIPKSVPKSGLLGLYSTLTESLSTLSMSSPTYGRRSRSLLRVTPTSLTNLDSSIRTTGKLLSLPEPRKVVAVQLSHVVEPEPHEH